MKRMVAIMNQGVISFRITNVSVFFAVEHPVPFFMRIKKILFSFVIIVTFSLYVVYQRKEDNRQSAGVAPSVTNTDSVFQEQQPSAPASVPIQTPAPIQKPAQSLGMYRDGTYTGSVADAYYGNIQVQATISAGTIIDVTFLQHPNDRRTSIFINDQAMPILSREALTVQSAQVDSVSGATDSSQAFQQSLAYALSQARN